MCSKFLSRFEVPEAALSVINEIVNADERLLVEALQSESFSASDASDAMQSTTGRTYSREEIDKLLKSAYRRGVVALIDDSFTQFRTGTFYSRLDVFVITEPEAYNAFPKEMRRALDTWYFNAYLNRLDREELCPTQDRVATLDETLAFLDTVTENVWLNRCDCRTLAGNCAHPTDTCISFRNGINTMSHRGWSKPLTKEQAKDVVRRADEAGLVHTVNPHTICNCCNDCCYLFRAQAARNSLPHWPTSSSVARYAAEICIGCGLCVERCPFSAFSMRNGDVTLDASLCRGCGLCANTCPTGAITIIGRET